MIRAYDDNGNVVDLVTWERRIRLDAFDRGYDKGRAVAIDRCIEIVSRETHDGTLCDYLADLKKYKGEE